MKFLRCSTALFALALLQFGQASATPVPAPPYKSGNATQAATGTFIVDSSGADASDTTNHALRVSAVLNTFWNETTGSGSALAGSGTFTGATARDVGVAAGIGHGKSYFVATFAADQAGTANILCSNDGSTWRIIATNALTAGSPLIMSVPVTTRYYKSQVINGSSAETYLWVDDAFTGA